MSMDARKTPYSTVFKIKSNTILERKKRKGWWFKETKMAVL